MAALSTAMHDGQGTRLRARSVLNEAKRELLALSNITAVQKIETLLERESVAAEDAEGLALPSRLLQTYAAQNAGPTARLSSPLDTLARRAKLMLGAPSNRLVSRRYEMA